MTTRRANAAVTLATTSSLALATVVIPTATASAAQPETLPESTRSYLFFESFDEIPNPAKFTHELPRGWKQNVTGVTSGEARWNGWTISTIREWTWTAGTEQRHYFTQGHDQMAIIDSQQQRLAPRDAMNATMASAPINVHGKEKVALEFDHHYKQGKAGQAAEVRVGFDGGEPEVVAKYGSDRLTSHEYIEVAVPKGATQMRVEFAYLGGNNDYWWAVDNVAVREVFAPVAEKPRTVIDVISDTQGDPADYKLVVRRLNAMPEKAQALVINGDLVDDGGQAQWDMFLKARDEAQHDSGVELWTIGNHELYGHDEDFQIKMDRFMRYSGQDTVWREVVVDGTPLISINTEYYQDSDRDGKEPFQRISAEQLAWLDSRLAHWDAQGVTALVFTHPLLPQTVSMSHSAWYQNDFEDTQAISDVLSKYNDIILFTSHSHASLRQPNWWGVRRYDGTPEGAIGFPVVNTGAILNEYMPDGDNDEEIVDRNAATGLRVKLYDDRTRVEAWDFKAGRTLVDREGRAEMIKYQDFSKQKRMAVSAPTTSPAAATVATTTTATTTVPVTVPVTKPVTATVTATATAPAPTTTVTSMTTTSETASQQGSSPAGKAALVIRILALVGGALAFFTPQLEQWARSQGLV